VACKCKQVCEARDQLPPRSSVCIRVNYFFVYFVYVFLFVSNSAIHYLEGLVSEIFYYMSSGRYLTLHINYSDITTV